MSFSHSYFATCGGGCSCARGCTHVSVRALVRLFLPPNAPHPHLSTRIMCVYTRSSELLRMRAHERRSVQVSARARTRILLQLFKVVPLQALASPYGKVRGLRARLGCAPHARPECRLRQPRD